MKKTRITILLIILNIAFAISIIFINQKMIIDAKKFANKHDADYIIYQRGVSRVEIDLAGHVFEMPRLRFNFIGKNGPIFYEEGEVEGFHLGVNNTITSWMIITSVGFVLCLFGIYYNSIHRLTYYGYVIGVFTCLLSVLEIGVLDNLHIYVASSFMVTAILIYREKPRKIKKVKPVIPLNELN